MNSVKSIKNTAGKLEDIFEYSQDSDKKLSKTPLNP